MVRFHWHVEDGFGAFIPPGGMMPHKATSVQHAVVEIEISGQMLNVEALLTIPPGYLQDSEIKEVGIVLAHGNDADEWRSKLLTELAVALSNAGHVVMRYHCVQKEQRRQRIFEKVLDACATSPFARMCSRWVLAGIGSGARVAAAVGSRCRGTMAGFVLISYPLMEPMPTSKGASMETSMLPLTKLGAPLLFVQPGQDPHCNASLIRENVDRMPAPDIRMLELPDADGALRTVQPGGLRPIGPQPHTIKRVVSAILDFVAAVNNNRLDLCKVNQLKGENMAPDSGNAPDPFFEEEQAPSVVPPAAQQQQMAMATTERQMSGSSASAPNVLAASPGLKQGPMPAGGFSAALLPALQGLLQGGLQGGSGSAAANLAAALGLGGTAPGLPGNVMQQQLMAAMLAAASKRPLEAAATAAAEGPSLMEVATEDGAAPQVLQLGIAPGVEPSS